MRYPESVSNANGRGWQCVFMKRSCSEHQSLFKRRSRRLECWIAMTATATTVSPMRASLQRSFVANSVSPPSSAASSASARVAVSAIGTNVAVVPSTHKTSITTVISQEFRRLMPQPNFGGVRLRWADCSGSCSTTHQSTKRLRWCNVNLPIQGTYLNETGQSFDDIWKELESGRVQANME